MLRVIIILALSLFFASPVFGVELVIGNPVVDNFTITIEASLSATTNYYLQGLLRSTASSKYFAETKNNKGDWVDYVSSPEKEFIVSNFFVTEVQNASWSGQMALRFKSDDPNYFGPGNYDLKLRRFTGNSSSSAGESNTLSIVLNVPLPQASPVPSPTPNPSPSPTPTPTPTPTPSPIPIPSPTVKPTLLPSSASLASLQPAPDGSVAGETIDLSSFTLTSPTASPSPSTSADSLTLRRDRVKNLLYIGAGLVLISISMYFALRKHINSPH